MRSAGLLVGLRYVKGGKSTSSSAGNAETHESDAPRNMKLSVLSLNMSACEVAPPSNV